MSNVIKGDYREQLLEAIKNINTDGLTDEIEEISTSTVVEEQKVYFWIRLYITDEFADVEVGDDIVITYNPSSIYLNNTEVKDGSFEKLTGSGKSEELSTKFICYGKKGLEKDHQDEVVNYTSEDDKKILCLMIDERVVNFGEGIPFIRTLFKTGRHYEFQIVRRSELLFINKRNGLILDYYDCDF